MLKEEHDKLGLVQENVEEGELLESDELPDLEQSPVKLVEHGSPE